MPNFVLRICMIFNVCMCCMRCCTRCFDRCRKWSGTPKGVYTWVYHMHGVLLRIVSEIQRSPVIVNVLSIPCKHVRWSWKDVQRHVMSLNSFVYALSRDPAILRRSSICFTHCRWRRKMRIEFERRSTIQRMANVSSSLRMTLKGLPMCLKMLDESSNAIWSFLNTLRFPADCLCFPQPSY